MEESTFRTGPPDQIISQGLLSCEGNCYWCAAWKQEVNCVSWPLQYNQDYGLLAYYTWRHDVSKGFVELQLPNVEHNWFLSYLHLPVGLTKLFLETLKNWQHLGFGLKIHPGPPVIGYHQITYQFVFWLVEVLYQNGAASYFTQFCISRGKLPGSLIFLAEIH